ncbi:MAG: P-loop NTPase [Candidatus Goldiibacteriota bacterium]
MIIAIASGKGGTGKTTAAVNLALSLDNAQLIDCDVEEPNAHLFLRPEIESSGKIYTPVPRVDHNKCTYCGNCSRVCEFGAAAVIPPSADGKGSGNVLIYDHLCHSCGACAVLCPQNAMYEADHEIGSIDKGKRGGLLYACGRLKIGEIAAPRLIRETKKCIDKSRTVIIDAPPGTSCPVIAAVSGSDYVLLAAEPTPFGVNDLHLTVMMLRKMSLPCGVLINRAGENDGIIEDYCARAGVDVILKIPFSRKAAEIYSRGDTLVETDKNYREIFKVLADKLTAAAGKK